MSDVRARRLRFGALSAAAIIAAPVIWNAAQNGASATHQPANKVAASGSEFEVVGPKADEVILSETVKINNPTDLILSASAECSIITQVKTTGDDLQTARARVRMWVTINGKPVPVSTNDTTEPGKVTFCDRIHEQETSLSGDSDNDDDNDTIRTYLNTRNANAFNWMAINVGSSYPELPALGANIFKIELHATLDTQGNATMDTFAEAIVGHRTLILEPVKAANDEVVEMHS